MAENPVVEKENTAPAASVPASPAPDATDAAPQADAADEAPTVHIADLVGEKKADEKGSGTPKPEDKPAKPSQQPAPEEKEEEQKFYKSQAEVDAAFGKRLKAEQKKWERQNATAFRALEVLRDINPGLTDEQLLKKLEGDRDEAFASDSTKLLEALKQRGTFGGKPQRRDEEDESDDSDSGEADVDTSEWTDEQADEAVKVVDAQAKEILQLDPDFDMEKFIESLGTANLRKIAAGKVSLKDFYLQREGAAALKRIHEAGIRLGGRQTAENIKSRNVNLPGPISPSAPPRAALDFTNMSDEEFAQYEEAVKKALSQGKKVVFGPRR